MDMTSDAFIISRKKGHPVFIPCALSLFSKEITVCPGSGKR